LSVSGLDELPEVVRSPLGILRRVTLGISIPWAHAKIGRWLLGATYYEGGGFVPTRIVPDASSARNRESGSTLTWPSFSSTLPAYTP
jgi:hypothetical protein